MGKSDHWPVYIFFSTYILFTEDSKSNRLVSKRQYSFFNYSSNQKSSTLVLATHCPAEFSSSLIQTPEAANRGLQDRLKICMQVSWSKLEINFR